ncbi:MAG: GTP pyrophosphokinase family protein [Lachnospiraceae bacterium]|nr:GTP pyrophosphokinase family protein [Lachnospiraceae bacterium]
MDIKLWREILDPYYLAVDELLVKFNHIIREHRNYNQYSPIDTVIGRVKSISSILDKVQKKGISLNEIEDKIDDIAGIRIICQFVEDIDKVVEIIRNRQDMRIKSEKDYISHMKESGYRSYHIIVYYTVNTNQGPKEIKAELQIRTLAMNFWATIEHSLQYKYKGNIPEHLKKKLSNASEAIIVLDEEMNYVRDEIMDAQNSFHMKDELVSEILNNIQNLYKVANKREVMKIQEEFYRIYTESDLDELKHYSKQLDMIAQSYKAQSMLEGN